MAHGLSIGSAVPVPGSWRDDGIVPCFNDAALIFDHNETPPVDHVQHLTGRLMDVWARPGARLKENRRNLSTLRFRNRLV